MAYNQVNPQGPLLPLPPQAQALDGGAPQHRRQGNARQGRPRRNNRGGGQGDGAPRQGPRVGPPRQVGAAPPPPGPPRPAYLATTSTPERNDPLWVNSLAGSELQPMPNMEYVQSGCEALPTVTSVIHTSCVAASPGYARRVPESALAYYCAVTTYARLLQLHMENGLMVSSDEERFVEQVRSLSLELPLLLAHYLAGFGNTRVPSGRDIRFRMRERSYTAIEGNSSGWFGQVSVDTQPLYQNYPCLAVYASRLQQDVSRDEYVRNWNVPVAIRPAGSGNSFPSISMLGYSWRGRLTEAQRGFVEMQEIFNDEAFPSANPELPLSINLLLAVQNELNAVATLKRSPAPVSIVGSQAQLGIITVENELAPIIEKTSVLETAYRMPQEISFSASAFTYRVKHAVERLVPGSDAPWVVWKLPMCDARDELAEVGNQFREYEPEFIQLAEFRTTPYLVRARLEALEQALSAR